MPVPLQLHWLSGGIVRRQRWPLWVIAPMGEPALKRLSAQWDAGCAIGGGMTVNIQGDVFAQDGYAFADKVTEALRRRGLVAVA